MSWQQEWKLTPQRAAIHLATATAVIADLHLGYGEARRRRGEAVPERSVDSVLAPLEALIRNETVEGLVIAGDLMETGRSAPIIEALLQWISAQPIELLGIVPGNHDRGIEQCSDRLPIMAEMRLGDWIVVHGDKALPLGRVVQGHVHPCLRHPRFGSQVCYLVQEEHLVLPAFTQDAAGVNVLRQREWSG